ncbi:unnamed protein product [Rotaria sp. Silwood1]|nr:unnamed protein product [Rotaria sp. Silwood1]
MGFYVNRGLFGITMDAMKSSHDKITFQSIEFWSNVCNEEYELQLLQQEHIQDVKHLFNRLLTIKSIPVVQQVYQAILADMTTNFNVLLQALQQKAIVVGSGTLSSPTTSDLNEDNAEVALIFDCSALCQIGNVKGNFIGMYALSPPLFQLLAKHLQLTNSKLARQYSAIHYGILKTLYSHCAAYEHFIHNSDLFKQNDTNNVMSLTSLTKDNFEDLLKLLHRLIVNSYLSCHDTNLFNLCRYWLQSNETSIYTILCCLPVNILTVKIQIKKLIKRFFCNKFSRHGTFLSSKKDYSIVKRNHMNTSYLGRFTRYCFLFNILVNHQTLRMYLTTLLECLFQSCQRKSNNESSKEEQLLESQHRLLSYEQLPNFGNDALLGFI